ncbi:hypothetical protein LCGC14_0772980 [marine sediment metagenome]|uniref:Uncharacterized protein n=1 Tax=marine sediment metagenome TaxID=412755 RepID=A0A0F9QHM0_9ZZZZ
MAIKGTIQQDHIQVNKFQLLVASLPPILFTTISGIEEELDTVELPDRTPQTGGRAKPVEFDATQPMHHSLERAAMDAWLRECTDPVSPFHKKIGTLIMESQTTIVKASFALLGLFVFKRATPDLDLENDGEMAMITWSFKAADLTRLG